MFKRYPYWGWLILGILLWSLTGYRYYQHIRALQPENMARAIADDLHNREKALNIFTSKQEVLKSIFSDSLESEEQEKLLHLPFYIFIYHKDSLTFWNTNNIQLTCSSEPGKIKFIRRQRGIFLQQCISLPFIDSQKKLVAAIPIVTLYPQQNDYLKSRFMAADNIPIETQVSADSVKGSIAVRNTNGIPVFYLKFPQHINTGPWVPDGILICLLIAGLLVSISWIQLTIIYFSKRSYLIGLLLTCAIVAILRCLIYIYGLPFGIENLPVFSPSLYASSIWLPSLGALIINTVCVLWLVVFIARHTPYKTFFSNLKPGALKNILAALFAIALVIYLFAFVKTISSLVIDSSISFDVSHFYSINIYTILGLFVIVAITIVSCLIIYLVNTQLSVLTTNKWIKYLLTSVVGLAYVFLYRKDGNYFNLTLLAWLILYIVLLDIKRLKLVADLFTPHMVFWAFFICAFTTGILQYFIEVKEHESRKIFAGQYIAPERDNVTEYTFSTVSDKIENDKVVRSFFSKATDVARKTLNERFDSAYFKGSLNKYRAVLYFFDKNEHGLFNKDTTSYQTLTNEINESTPTPSNTLYYKEHILDGHHYTAYIPIQKDSLSDPMGYVFIDLSLKRTANETVYPELLQAPGTKPTVNENEYAYAVYINSRLISQTNNFPFPVYLKDTLHSREFGFNERSSYSELLYKYSDRKTVVLVRYHNYWFELTTLFSYLFGIEISVAVLILLYQLYLSYFTSTVFIGKFIKLTLRRRVHYSMLIAVLLSFCLIGIVTILFFKDQYNTSNKNKLQSAMQFVEQAVQQYVKQENLFRKDNRLDSTNHSFKYFITNLASSRQIDINVYNDNGRLNVASQEDIYDKHLLTRLIRPDAYYQLTTLGKSIVIQDEKIGALSYLSCYVPVRDERGITLAYINVPFFSSQKDLNFQISNIVVTLINLYAFIFLVSGLFTVLITRWLTRTLNVIIQQFGRLNLQRNERITWPYDDEIGLLVREYNSMVKKVEENAILLAQSERETAWREMARQVAHEIKNPLTPMKLNIQYLQQALKNNQVNIKELVDKVADSLVEQIDNLSYIASEFSNFAKMPEARPEKLELGELLERCVELHFNTQNIAVSLNTQAENLFVYADRSQLLRVFNNLLENAKQAIPENRHGNIEVLIKKENEYAVVTVSDNGIGMSEEVVKKIFHPYFTTKTSGTGLGLAMTKKIIEFWKGEIWFDTKEDEGTVFSIRLPLVDN